jgi:hypothetical protein
VSRARSIEIYLKPGVEEDDRLHDTWEMLRDCARPQDVFRRALRRGLLTMAQTGELPVKIVEAMYPGLRIRDRRRTQTNPHEDFSVQTRPHYENTSKKDIPPVRQPNASHSKEHHASTPTPVTSPTIQETPALSERPVKTGKLGKMM